LIGYLGMRRDLRLAIFRVYSNIDQPCSNKYALFVKLAALCRLSKSDVPHAQLSICIPTLSARTSCRTSLHGSHSRINGNLFSALLPMEEGREQAQGSGLCLPLKEDPPRFTRFPDEVLYAPKRVIASYTSAGLVSNALSIKKLR
jgi:hypothetical protein